MIDLPGRTFGWVRKAAAAVHAFFSMPHDKPELVKAQYAAFQQQMPLLYFILLANSWVLAWAYLGHAPLWLTIGLPLVLSLVCARRIVMWWRSRHSEVTHAKARTELARTNILAWGLAVAFSAWAIGLYPYGTPPMQMHVAFYMAITAVGCMFCLSHLRSAAIAVMATINLAFVGFFSLSGDATYIALSVNVVLISCAMLVILLFNYRDFNALVQSRQVLQEERARALELSNENFRLANRDSLTNLSNRRSFLASLATRVGEADAEGSRVVLGILDLDGFKPINDTYGHPAGDALLRSLVERLQTRAGDDVQVFRLGGDEFALLFASPDIGAAQAAANDVCALLREPFNLAGCTARISGTMGLAVYPDMASDACELFARADYAMYRAKRGMGRGEVWLFTDQDEAEIKRSSVIEQALKGADLEQELSMMFQPIVDIHTGRTIGFEALARWHHPELGNIAPAEFIPNAERAGLINTLTLVLLRKALATAETWPADMRLSFNLSVFDIASPESLMRIAATIGQSRVSPFRIDLELTETAMVKDFGAFMAAVDTLKRIGVGISLDDFGNGYSSLRQVHQLPLDKLKIDRSFVANVDQNVASQKIIKSLISLCQDLKLSCVIEGVETAGELEAIRGLGCQLVQGYYYSRPMAPQDIEEFLKLDHADPGPAHHRAARVAGVVT